MSDLYFLVSHIASVRSGDDAHVNTKNDLHFDLLGRVLLKYVLLKGLR